MGTDVVALGRALERGGSAPGMWRSLSLRFKGRLALAFAPAADKAPRA